MEQKINPQVAAFRDSLSETHRKVYSKIINQTGPNESISELLDCLTSSVPFFSIVKKSIQFASTVKQFIFYRNYAVFLNELMCSEQKSTNKLNYVMKFDKLNEEEKLKMIQYTLLFIDECQDVTKPKLLSKLFIAFLEKRIDFITFRKYCECVLRFIIGDYETLCSNLENITHPLDNDGIIRLMTLGLVTLGRTESKCDFVDGTGSVCSISFNGTCKLSFEGEKLLEIIQS